MAKYLVTSDRLTLGREGDTVDIDDDGPVNVQALVESGHLRPAPKPAPKAGPKPKGDS